MATFMLDTDTVSYALRGQGGVATHLLSHRSSEIHISSITLSELRFGAERKKSRKLHAIIDSFTRDVRVLPFDELAANSFGIVAAALAVRGTPIGEFDTLIAAHALSVRMILVTNNARHFAKVTGLKTENWI